MSDRFDQQAFVGLSRDDDWSGITPAPDGIPRIEPQAPFGPSFAVTFMAMRDE
jgi:hypothetical protein